MASRTHARVPRLTRRVLNTVLETRPDPLGVLETTAYVVEHAEHVTIDLNRVETVSRVLALRPVPVPEWNYNLHFFDGTAATVNYMFLLDALNFSFWGAPRWTVRYREKEVNGYWALAAALKRAVEANARVLDAEYLADIRAEEFARLLRGENEIPMLVERWHNVQELGRVLRDRYEGNAALLVERAEHDAARLARLIVENLSSFDDTSIYRRRGIKLYKRAQILVADLYGAFQGRKWGRFENLAVLTSFADYKLPQILRAWGILKYDRKLARAVDHQVELKKDSPEEVEIRSSMLWAVELLREAIKAHGQGLTSVQMDWYLWEASQNMADARPYHRVRTIYY